MVLIDWDGFDPAFLDWAPTPNLDALAGRGSLTVGSSTFQTVSNPARASMSTGAYPDTHNNAAYYFDSASNTAKGQERYLEAETIAEALAEEGRTVASVQWSMVQNHGATYGDAEHLYVQPGGDFGRRVDVAIDILNQRPVDSVRYGDITLRGRAGTEEGRADVRAALESLLPSYISQVLDDADLDAMRASPKLGDLVAEAQPPYGFALSEPPEGEWRASHGSTQELDVPFLVSGAGFRRGVPPEGPNLVDVAPTIAALLGVAPPDHSQGRILTEAMGPPSSPRANLRSR